MKNGEGFWGFIDWTDGLNKQTAMQGVYIYCAKKVQRLQKSSEIQKKQKSLKKKQKKRLQQSENIFWMRKQACL